MHLSELIPLVQMAVGPVILISGVGLLLLSMTNRFGRVIDRTRLVVEAHRKGGSDPAARYAAQLKVLHRRATVLQRAIILAVLSVLCAALLVMAIFIVALLNADLALPVIILFLGAMFCLIASLLFFIQDLNLSLDALKHEVG
jgi:hypothetical protein